MLLKYLGTAAGEGYPAIFCGCERCQNARKLGGKNLRARSSAIIDNKILIDFGPDNLLNIMRYGLDLTCIKTLLITHIHVDHFYLADLNWRLPNYASLPKAEKLNIYGSTDIDTKEINAISCPNDSAYGFRINVQKPFEPFYSEGYKITALPANHGTNNPYIYIIEKEGKAILYANDTGLLSDEAFDYIKNSGVIFSLVSLDCTAGARPIDYETHMNIERNLIFKTKLLSFGAANENTKFVLNHFSHNGFGTLHDDISTTAEGLGMIASYDGLEIEV